MKKSSTSSTGSAASATTTNATKNRWLQRFIQVILHGICMAMYIKPILSSTHIYNKYAGPTLDEMHIMSHDNHDIQGNATLAQIFSNDYWGRPMQSESSHKSWRPLTVLSFRYLKGMYTSYQLTTHRILNVVAHACTADLVGILAVRLIPGVVEGPTAFLVHLFTKLLFGLHPTHVEVTANAANRPHILAVLCSVALCDPSLPMLLFGLALVLGFLCSETFLFQLPAAIVTMVVIRNHQRLCMETKQSEEEQQEENKEKENPFPKSKNDNGGTETDGDDDEDDDTATHPKKRQHFLVPLILSAISLIPRIFLVLLAIAVYLGGRYHFDTLDIPEGLIRPAENPFYHFSGRHRVRNYLYVLAIHVAKSWGLDPIGFSHEYGFDCIPALESWSDPRLALPAVLFGTLIVGTLILLVVVAVKSGPKNGTTTARTFYHFQVLLGCVLVHWAWLFTLFPISGVVKVGTFVADRIVVASTVSVCIWLGYALVYWMTVAMHFLPAKPLQALLIGWILAGSYLKINNRTIEWMDSISLMESALVTCPRFAKVHMEMSKIYSGLYPDKLNLATSRYHLEQAQAIDPALCDIHQQFAHVAIQQGNYLEYEDELTQAVLCPFTMGGALEMWQRYWQVALNSATPAQMEAVQERQARYTRIIQQAVEVEKAKEEEAIRNGKKAKRQWS
jgi:protein O-mannosyl-transferase